MKKREECRKAAEDFMDRVINRMEPENVKQLSLIHIYCSGCPSGAFFPAADWNTSVGSRTPGGGDVSDGE